MFRKILFILGGFLLLGVVGQAQNAWDCQLPALPASTVTTTFSVPSGDTITVTSSDNIQTAIDTATAGEVILIEAGATFSLSAGLTLPWKSGNDWIYIMSDQNDSLSANGTRVSLADTAYMPLIKLSSATSGDALVDFSPRANKYRLVGLYLKSVSDGTANRYEVVRCGAISGQNTHRDSIPTNIIFDRIVIAGTDEDAGQTVRGISLAADTSAVIDSYIHNIRDRTADSQAILVSNCEGPVLIDNNFLEGAGENFFVAGLIPKSNYIDDILPKDIVFTNNYVFKRLEWWSQHGTYNGFNQVVKNSWELKGGVRILCQGNVFQNDWNEDQAYSIVLTPRNSDGGWAGEAITDITFKENVLIDHGWMFSVAADEITSGRENVPQTQKILFQGNLAKPGPANIQNIRHSSVIRGVQTTGREKATIDLAFVNNTFAYSNPGATNARVVEMTRSWPTPIYTTLLKWTWKNNVLSWGTLGIRGDGLNSSVSAIESYSDLFWFDNNVFFGGTAVSNSGAYGTAINAANAFIANASDVGFVDYPGGDYTISGDHAGKGANIAKLDSIETCVTAGTTATCPATDL